jgi:uncharacterized peroxidase-related enzyme
MPDTHIAPEAAAISRLTAPAPGQEPAEARDVVSRHHGDHWIRSLALNPDTANRFAAYFESLFRANGGRLPLRERELIAVAVSVENGCGLCTIHHTLALGEELGDHVRARRIALDHHLANLTAREQALVDLAVKVTRAPKSVSRDDFEPLRAAGLADQDILEAVETSAWFNHTNRIFITLGVPPDERYFAR